MNINITITHAVESSALALLNRILSSITLAEHKVMAELQTLQDRVASIHTVSASAVELLNGLKSRLDAAIAAGDPAALVALSDALGADTDALAAAVVANTPAV